MAPKLINKQLPREVFQGIIAKEAAQAEAFRGDREYIAKEIAKAEAKEAAKEAAKDALREWYAKGFHNAEKIIPFRQIDENLQVVAAIPDWVKQKGERNGYVMLSNVSDQTTKPITLVLSEFWWKQPKQRGDWIYPGRMGKGGLTYLELHQQIRDKLKLEPDVSLRLCPFRPWYRHMQESIPIPESRALPNTNDQCRHLLGTTLMYCTYAHIVVFHIRAPIEIDIQ